MVAVSKHDDSDIIEISRKILFLAQNFDKTFPGLENLKKSHFQQIAVLVPDQWSQPVFSMCFISLIIQIS
jgi:hypothetical protein